MSLSQSLHRLTNFFTSIASLRATVIHAQCIITFVENAHCHLLVYGPVLSRHQGAPNQPPKLSFETLCWPRPFYRLFSEVPNIYLLVRSTKNLLKLGLPSISSSSLRMFSCSFQLCSLKWLMTCSSTSFEYATRWSGPLVLIFLFFIRSASVVAGLYEPRASEEDVGSTNLSTQRVTDSESQTSV